MSSDQIIQKQLKRTKKDNKRKEKLEFLLKRMVSLTLMPHVWCLLRLGHGHHGYRTRTWFVSGEVWFC